MAYQFYQQTGLEGGILNPSDNVVYVDSFSGDDANNGGNSDPVVTTQQAIDIVSTYMGGSGIIVMSGYFREGNFAENANVEFIAEGYVYIDGDGFATFSTKNAKFNYTYSFGRFCFLSFTDRIGSYDGSAPVQYMRDCDFMFCLRIGSVSGKFSVFENNFVYNSICGGLGFTSSPTALVANNTFVNSVFNWNGVNSGSTYVYNNYFDETSKFLVKAGVTVPFEAGVFDYNHFRGTIANKIYYNSIYYDNIEDFKAGAGVALAVNDIPSTAMPLFNLINDNDYTLSPQSPLLKGYSRKHIGCFGLAKAVSASDAVWVADGVDNTSVNGEATLTATPTGTLRSGGIKLSDYVVELKRLNLPDMEVNPASGNTISSNVSSDKTPCLIDVEIQYSSDGGTVFNGTWLRCPIGMQPLHDLVNDVGNDDPAFVLANARPIRLTHIMYKVTLRDDEVEI